MKLLFDENLPPSLALAIADLFPQSAHVHELGLGSADDRAIWQHARDGGFVIVSKDSDYHDFSVLHGAPPKVIWLRVGNCNRAVLTGLLRDMAIRIHEFDASDAALLILRGL